VAGGHLPHPLEESSRPNEVTESVDWTRAGRQQVSSHIDYDRLTRGPTA